MMHEVGKLKQAKIWGKIYRLFWHLIAIKGNNKFILENCVLWINDLSKARLWVDEVKKCILVLNFMSYDFSKVLGSLN